MDFQSYKSFSDFKKVLCLISTYSLMFVLILFVSSCLATDYSKICGSSYVGVGYDYVTNEFKFPIFTNTFNASDPTHVWQNPFYPEDPELVPEEMVITNTPESFTLEGVMVHHILDNYTKEISYHYSDSGLLSKHTKDIYYFIHRLLVYDNDQGFSWKRVSWYTLELDPLLMFVPWKYFNPTFQAAIDALPEDLDGSHKYLYELFLRTYGTSYVRRAVMGGEVQLHAWLNDCFIQQKSESWVQEQTSFSFLGLINYGHNKEKYESEIDSTFLEHVEMDMYTIGGIWINGSSWDDYKLTLTGQLLQPLYYSVNSITELFTDKAKKQNMQTVIDEYVNSQTDLLNTFITDTKKEPKEQTPNWCSQIKRED